MSVSTKELILVKIDAIRRELEACVEEGRPEAFTLSYFEETRKRHQDDNDGESIKRPREAKSDGEIIYDIFDYNTINQSTISTCKFSDDWSHSQSIPYSSTSLNLGDEMLINPYCEPHIDDLNHYKVFPDKFVRVPKTLSFHSAAFPRLLKLLVVVQDNLNSGRKSTKRDVYYQDVAFWRRQSYVDTTLDLCAKILRVPRNDLGIVAAAKGFVAGQLSFYDSFKCKQVGTFGISVPFDDVTELKSEARHILVVEKQATYQQILSSGALSQGRELQDCILVTGCGYPDYNTRKFVRFLWTSLNIPVLLLMDCDPHGIHIASIYKFGSQNLNEEKHLLTVPPAKWLGILPSDLHRKLVPASTLLPLTETDRSKLSSLHRHPDLCAKSPDWLKQIELMSRIGRKAEIQSVAEISPDFLHNSYLPLKIKYHGWIS